MKFTATTRMWGSRMHWLTRHKELVITLLTTFAAIAVVLWLCVIMIKYVENLKAPASKAMIEKTIAEHESPLCMHFVLKRHYQANQLITNRVMGNARAECNGKTVYGDGAAQTQQFELQELFK